MLTTMIGAIRKRSWILVMILMVGLPAAGCKAGSVISGGIAPADIKS